jgi:hypothetical protein
MTCDATCDCPMGALCLGRLYPSIWGHVLRPMWEGGDPARRRYAVERSGAGYVPPPELPPWIPRTPTTTENRRSPPPMTAEVRRSPGGFDAARVGRDTATLRGLIAACDYRSEAVGLERSCGCAAQSRCYQRRGPWRDDPETVTLSECLRCVQESA